MSDVDIFDPTQLKKKKVPQKVEIFDPTLIEKQVEETEIFDPTERVEPPISPMYNRPEPEIVIPQADDARLQEVWDQNATGEKLIAAKIFAEQLEISEEEAFNNIDSLLNIVDPNGDPKTIPQKFLAGIKHWQLAEEANELSFKQLVGELNFPEIYQAQIDEEKAKDEPDEGKLEKLESKLKQANDVAVRMEELETRMGELTPEDARFWKPEVAYTAGQITRQMLAAMQEGFVYSIATAGAGALAASLAGPGGTLAGTAGGFTFGLAAGMTSYNFRQMSGTSWREMINDGVDKRWARPIALASGAFQAAAELMQQVTFVKTIPGFDKVLMKAGENAVTTMIKNRTFKTLAANAADKLGKIGLVGAEEVTIELFQNVIDGIADYVAVELENKYRKDPDTSMFPELPNFFAFVTDMTTKPRESEHPDIEARQDRKPPELMNHQEWRDFVKEQVATIINMGLASFLIATPGGTLTFAADVKVMQQERFEADRLAREARVQQALKEIDVVKGEVIESGVHPDIEKGEHQPIDVVVPEETPDILVHPEQTEVTPVSPKEKEAEFQTAYEGQKEVFFRRRDDRLDAVKVENRALQKELKVELGLKRYTQQAKDTDAAMDMYTDSKTDPNAANIYYDQVSKEDQAIYDLSQKLTKEEKKIVTKINKEYKNLGEEALEVDVIANLRENFTNRIWDRGGDEAAAIYRKFGTTTRHAKQRVFDTILEGLAKGYKLKVRGATNNLAIYKDEMIKTIENKKFMNALIATKTIDGSPLMTTKNLKEQGYKEVTHPNWRQWSFAGKADPSEIYGKDFFAMDDGTLLEKRRLYAPAKIANNLNNIFGVSKLNDYKAAQVVTKYNAVTKAWILASSFFHHLAMGRSYYLGGDLTKLKDLNIVNAFKEGVKAIENRDPDIRLGIQEGLTLGLNQDWQESLVEEGTFIEKILDKNKVTKATKDAILDLRRRHVDFLFGEFAPGLKATTYLIEFRKEMRRNPNGDPRAMAKNAANLINDDFGGLHLERIGRDPTLQHIFRLTMLAPDWTESNIRSMAKAIHSGSKEETQMYRRFWGRIMVKGAAVTALANFALAGGDVEEMVENYKTAWKAGNLKWLDVDITPVYKLLGGETERRKFLSVFGHFKDPLKFVTDPIRSLHHKGSVISGVGQEALSGVDWAGRKFTTLGELIETGETVKFGQGGAISWEQFPSYVLSQLKGFQPVQIQNILAWAAGEMEAFDAFTNSLGLGVRTTFE